MDPSWNDIGSYPLHNYQCGSTEVIPDNGFKSCACLDAQELNSLYQVLGRHLTIEMSSGQVFIGMNLATDKSPVPNYRDAKFPFEGRAEVGKAACLYISDSYEEILEMDLSSGG